MGLNIEKAQRFFDEVKGKRLRWNMSKSYFIPIKLILDTSGANRHEMEVLAHLPGRRGSTKEMMFVGEGLDIYNWSFDERKYRRRKS
jgi:hypothetical protein